LTAARQQNVTVVPLPAARQQNVGVLPFPRVQGGMTATLCVVPVAGEAKAKA
jgi:hypothetical protein